MNDSVVIAVEAALTECYAEVDSRLSHTLSKVEERHEQQTAALMEALAQARSKTEDQAAQIEALSSQLRALRARLDPSAKPSTAGDATKIVAAAEARFRAALTTTECRINEAVTAVKVSTAHQLQEAQSTFSFAIQEAEDRFLQLSKVRPGMPPRHVANHFVSTEKRLDDLEARLRDLEVQFKELSPRQPSNLAPKLFSLNTRLGLLETRVTASECRAAQGSETPPVASSSASSNHNGIVKGEMRQLSQRLHSVEASCSQFSKEQQKLIKRLHTLGASTGSNNISLVQAQQTLGERLRLLEDTVEANKSEQMTVAGNQSALMEDLKSVVEAIASSAAAISDSPQTDPTGDGPSPSELKELADLVEKHEAFFACYGDRVIAVTLTFGGGKTNGLTLSGAERVQECLSGVQRLSARKASDVAQFYINRLEKKKTKPAQSEEQKRIKVVQVKDGAEKTEPQERIEEGKGPTTDGSAVAELAQEVEDRLCRIDCETVQ